MTTWTPYAQVPGLLMVQFLHLQNDAYKVALLNTSYPVGDVSTLIHFDFATNIQPFEVSGTNYTAGGNSLSGHHVFWDIQRNEWQWRCPNVVWADLGLDVGTIGAASIYHVTSGRAVAFCDLRDQPSTGRDATLIMPANGILQFPPYKASSNSLLGMGDVSQEVDIVSVI